jgi:hypothetical protein
MRIFKFFTLFLIISFQGSLFSEENIIKFSDIPWEASPEQIILIEGLPDAVYYYYDWDENGEEVQISMKEVWTNSTGVNINNIINAHYKIAFRYYNIQLFDFISEVFLDFEDSKFYSIYYIVEISNLTDLEKLSVSINLQNYIIQYYGSPDDHEKNGTSSRLKWDSNDTLIQLEIWLPQSDPLLSKYRYVDNIGLSYWYKKL